MDEPDQPQPSRPSRIEWLRNVLTVTVLIAESISIVSTGVSCAAAVFNEIVTLIDVLPS